MGKLLNIVTPLHKKTQRKYLERMMDDKVHCMLKAKEYEYDYWDGDRRYGYGGYRYDSRWKPVVEELIKEYQLDRGQYPARILDVGCGKGFLLYELKQLLPEAEVWGFDISRHAIAHAPPKIRNHLFVHDIREPTLFQGKCFDLVISLGCLHNLKLPDVQNALGEIMRIGVSQYIMVESYRNEQEQFNLQCWALTAETELSSDTWIWLFKEWKYTGDYEFIYFE